MDAGRHGTAEDGLIGEIMHPVLGALRVVCYR